MERVLEHGAEAVVVLGRDDDVAVSLRNPFLPLGGERRVSGAEERQLPVLEVDVVDFELSVLLRFLPEPGREQIALPLLPCAAEDDLDLRPWDLLGLLSHGCLFLMLLQLGKRLGVKQAREVPLASPVVHC